MGASMPVESQWVRWTFHLGDEGTHAYLGGQERQDINGHTRMAALKTQYARLVQLAVEEEKAALIAQCRRDDILLIEQHKRRAFFFRQQADILAKEIK